MFHAEHLTQLGAATLMKSLARTIISYHWMSLSEALDWSVHVFHCIFNCLSNEAVVTCQLQCWQL